MAARPKWISQFVSEVCSSLHSSDGIPTVGCHVAEAEEMWEVTVFFSPTEILGGEHDGSRNPYLYIMDALSLIDVFDAVESASWQPMQLDADDDLRNHFAVIGAYRGHLVWLRVLAEIPEHFEPGLFFDHNSGRILDSWQS